MPLEYWAVFMTSVILAIILAVLCVHANYSVSIKPDTLLLVGGNFAIAYWIASVINKKHKNNELKISNCFAELDSLLLLLNKLRIAIKDDNFDIDDIKHHFGIDFTYDDFKKHFYGLLEEGKIIQKFDTQNKKMKFKAR